MNEIKRRPGARRPGATDEPLQKITTADDLAQAARILAGRGQE